MKKIVFIALLSLFFSVNAMACTLRIYVDSSESNTIVFNIISTDNKYQLTGAIAPGKNDSFPNMTCVAYNIYAEKINKLDGNKGPYGDYSYVSNPLQLTSDVSLYFPQDFKLDFSLSKKSAY